MNLINIILTAGTLALGSPDGGIEPQASPIIEQKPENIVNYVGAKLCLETEKIAIKADKDFLEDNNQKELNTMGVIVETLNNKGFKVEVHKSNETKKADLPYVIITSGDKKRGDQSIKKSFVVKINDNVGDEVYKKDFSQNHPYSIKISLENNLPSSCTYLRQEKIKSKKLDEEDFNKLEKNKDMKLLDYVNGKKCLTMNEIVVQHPPFELIDVGGIVESSLTEKGFKVETIIELYDHKIISPYLILKPDYASRSNIREFTAILKDLKGGELYRDTFSYDDFDKSLSSLRSSLDESLIPTCEYIKNSVKK